MFILSFHHSIIFAHYERALSISGSSLTRTSVSVISPLRATISILNLYIRQHRARAIAQSDCTQLYLNRDNIKPGDRNIIPFPSIVVRFDLSCCPSLRAADRERQRSSDESGRRRRGMVSAAHLPLLSACCLPDSLPPLCEHEAVRSANVAGERAAELRCHVRLLANN